MLICHCTFADGKVYPDPNFTCPNGHIRGQQIDERIFTWHDETKGWSSE